MEEPKIKTIGEHREYMHGIVRLKLFFLHRWLKEHPEETFQNALRNRVDIYRKTHANKGLLNPVEFYFDEEPWLTMEKQAEEIFEQYKDDEAAFEEKAFQVFRPSLDKRLLKDYLDKSGLRGYQCGSLRHNLEANKDNPEAISLGFHIANAVAPHSIFDDPQYLKNCLLQLCDKAETEYGATVIATGTWLNQNKKWLSYFPQEWLDNMSEPVTDIQWHYGFWGQFISARGTLNERYADILRSTGKMPYYPCRSRCRISELRKHLETI